MVRFAIIVVVAIAGCFTPSHDRCAVTCATADQSCPPGFSCLSDGFCHAAATESLCSLTTDAAVDAPIDAGPGCGDGVRQTDMNEECDDNNRDDNDGCSAICREESGFVCVGDPGELSVCRPNPSQAGDLVITELLIDPGLNDEFREWFEVHNPTDTDFDLRGMRIESPQNEVALVVDSLVIEAKDHLVFGRTLDTDMNGGAPVDHAYGSLINLSNGGDDLEIQFNGVVIDAVSYGAAPPNSASLSLSSLAYDAVSNDMSINFCPGVGEFGTGGDEGTPGDMNPEC